MFERICISSLYFFLGSIAAVHKLLSPFIPDWFHSKFEHTFLNWIPGGLYIAYGIIITLEIAIPVLFLFGMLRKEFQNNNSTNFTAWGSKLSLVLFLILFFGSFLVQDYENGFNDFMYFAATLFLMRFSLNKTQGSN